MDLWESGPAKSGPAERTAEGNRRTAHTAPDGGSRSVIISVFRPDWERSDSPAAAGSEESEQ
ncbi:hypothetical protein GCM10027440_33640 [Nocardiopsis coralliicola]